MLSTVRGEGLIDNERICNYQESHFKMSIAVPASIGAVSPHRQKAEPATSLHLSGSIYKGRGGGEG